MKALPSDWNRIGILRNDCSPIEEQQTGNPLDSIALARPASTKESGLEICDRRRDTMPPCASLFPTEKPPPLSSYIVAKLPLPREKIHSVAFQRFRE